MATKEIEQEVRFLAYFQPLKAPKSINGFRLIRSMLQKSETFYFDTTDEELFRKKSTLRIRKFSGEWLITLKAQETDPSKSSETSQPITEEDLYDILRGESRVQDFFDDSTLLPVNPLSLVGHLITHRIAILYRKSSEEVEVAFDECWDDLPIGPFYVAEIENRTASEDSFIQLTKCFARLLPIIPASLSKYMILRKRQRREPIQETLDLGNGVKETVRVIRTLLKTGENSPIVVFVGGGSASGKTELFAKKICKVIKGARLLSMDDCFHGPAWMKANRRKNWDDPEVMDIPLFRQWILDLLDGKPISKKVYSFGKGPEGTETIDPPKVLIVEGIHAHHETLDGIPGLRIFVDATTHCRFIRRMYRDALKGRTDQTPSQVFKQFFETVEPAHQQWIEPTKAKAHIVVQNRYNPLKEAEAIQKPDLQWKVRGHVSQELLVSLGAIFVWDHEQQDMYYSPRDIDVALRGEMIRIRQTENPDQFLLSYKAMAQNGRVRFDATISPQEKKIFERYYEQTAMIRKRRRIFILPKDDITINLDTVEDLGEWTEFCTNDSKQETILKELMELLGRDPISATNQTYLSMLLTKNPAP